LIRSLYFQRALWPWNARVRRQRIGGENDGGFAPKSSVLALRVFAKGKINPGKARFLNQLSVKLIRMPDFTHLKVLKECTKTRRVKKKSPAQARRLSGTSIKTNCSCCTCSKLCCSRSDRG
jgi:hypothetical protein